jgi:hypothetical protein
MFQPCNWQGLTYMPHVLYIKTLAHACESDGVSCPGFERSTSAVGGEFSFADSMGGRVGIPEDHAVSGESAASSAFEVCDQSRIVFRFHVTDRSVVTLKICSISRGGSGYS